MFEFNMMFEIKSKEINQKEIKILRMKLTFLELIPDFQNDIKIFRIKSRFSEGNQDFQNEITIFRIPDF